jgi:four helix bundle protein
MEEQRRNINRGYKKLRVWQNSVDLFLLSNEIITDTPFELKKVVSNSLDACHSISRNIAEGYCRKSLKEYLYFLNVGLASCGEFHSCLYTLWKAGIITEKSYEKLDELQYMVENQLLKLISTLQKKMKNNDWLDEFIET